MVSVCVAVRAAVGLTGELSAWHAFEDESGGALPAERQIKGVMLRLPARRFGLWRSGAMHLKLFCFCLFSYPSESNSEGAPMNAQNK